MGKGFRLPPLFTIPDFVLIVLIGAFSAGFYVYRLQGRPDNGRPIVAVVQFEERELASLPLDSDTSFVAQGAHSRITVVVAGGAVKFEDANCPARICERTGWVRRPGAAIVCAPNRVIARVKYAGAPADADEGGLDALSR